jgi:hypothetical protein
MDTNGNEGSFGRGVNEQAFDARGHIADINTWLLLTASASPIEVSLATFRRMIDHFDIEILTHPFPNRGKFIAFRKVGVTDLLLFLNPFTCLGQCSVFEPAIWITYDGAMKDFFDRSESSVRQ